MADFSSLKSRIIGAGLSPGAVDWLLKAMSPASTGGKGCTIPDESAAPVATPEFVQEFTVPPPSNVIWDMIVITPPTYPLVAMIWTAPTGFNFSATQWAGTGAGAVILAEPATSAVVDATTVQQYILGAAASTNVTHYTPWPSTQPNLWRTSYRSITGYLVASDLNNQGTVSVGQYPTDVTTFNPWSAYAAVDYSFETLELPLTEQDMTSLAPKIRVAPAKTGVYLPHYEVGPQFPYCKARNYPGMGQDYSEGAGGNNTTFFPPTPGINALISQSQGLPTLLMPTDSANGTVQTSLPAGYGSLVVPFTATNPYTWGVGTGMTGVQIWRGLSPGASVTFKTVLGLEICPSPTSPIRQFVMPPGAYEPKALELYFALIQEMPHSYPASANFLNTILTGISQLLPVVLPHISSALSHFFPRPAPPVSDRAAQPEMASSAVSRTVRTPARPRASSVASRRSSVRSSKQVRVKIAKKAKRRVRALPR
jgi:hypothetical protein